MKIISKKAYGGEFLAATYGVTSPVVTAQEHQTNNEEKSNKSDGSSNKTLIEQIFDPKLNILPSDAAILADLAESVGTMESSEYFSTLAKPKQWATIYKMYVTKANQAKNNYENMVAIKNNLISKGAAQDAAVTNEGYVFVHKGGSKKISIILPQEFNKKEDTVVTNAELTYIRANDPQYAFNDKISETLMGATSYKEIREIITDAIRNANEFEDGKTVFVNPNTAAKTADGLKLLASIGITIEDLQKMDPGTLIKSKTDTSSNAKQIQAAIAAIEDQLSPQQKALLELRARQIGGEANYKSVILEYAASEAKGKVSQTLDFVNPYQHGNAEAKEKRVNAQKIQDEAKMKALEMPTSVQFLNSYGLKKRFRFSDGSRGSLFVSGAQLPITKSGKAIGDVPLNLVGVSDYAGVLDKSNVTIGGVHIDQNLLGSVLAYTGNTVNAPLPVDQQKLLSENVIAPDLDLTKRLDEAWRLLIAKGITGKNRQEIDIINKTLQAKGLPAMFTGTFDAQGNPVINLTQYARFAVIDGIVDGGILEDGQEFTYHLLELSDKEKQAAINSFRAVNEKFNATPGGWFSKPKFYRGTIFIPINDNAINAYAGSGVNLTTSQAELLERADADRKQRVENPASSRYKQNTFNISYQ